MLIVHKKRVRLTSIENSLEEWIENNIETFINLRENELADYILTTPSAISVYIKKIGYKNYKEFQQQVIQNYDEQKKKDKNPFTNSVFKTSIYYDIKQYINSLLIDNKFMLQIYNSFSKAENIGIVKYSNIDFSTLNLEKFLTTNKNKILINDDLKNIKSQNTLFIVFDNFYESVDIEKIIKNIHDSNNYFIVFSNKNIDVAQYKNGSFFLIKSLFGDIELNKKIAKNFFIFVLDLMIEMLM
ncbi:hypothetical protein [Mesomycoplasma molare]|uniref:HTH rpiR-type domain-containing protein n=1 Tax=Mesomycoplasma molare TaxID=171288 RepID=A0ABY5TV42_9BACT|nr:hypothetical protein [Mesomycoplasma molare]UWD33886.1 hypothetical protein NX772_02125 [Mesomycoplasma molare]